MFFEQANAADSEVSVFLTCNKSVFIIGHCLFSKIWKNRVKIKQAQLGDSCKMIFMYFTTLYNRFLSLQ